tara:strand:+ start:459 stop:1379 length:921 start_codon:yes stop_codon:yes gene_type:complete
MKKVFVTGGHGFLGTSLVEVLKKNNLKLFAPKSSECDLTLESSLKNYSHDEYDYIFHLAAWTQAGDFCLKHPGEQWLINQKINTNTLNWWKEKQPQAKLIFMGTSCSYPPELDLNEENYMSGEPIDSLYTYAMTKRMLLQGARAINKQYGLNYLCLVPSTLYGPGYHTDGRQMHFIFDLIKKIMRGKKYEEKVVLWGDGEQKREIVYINDFITALLKLSKQSENDIINIGAGTEKSIREFAKIICRIIGFDETKIVYDLSKYVGAKSKKLEINKLISIYPEYIENLTKIEDGIKSVIDWFEINKTL